MKHRYPLPEKTVLYSRKKRLESIPKVGKKYHCFDDGKITFSRHYVIEVLEVLGQMSFKKKYPELFRRWLIESKDHYWLFSRSTDKYVVSNTSPTQVFVRTKQGGWFSFSDNYLYSGELDITGKVWESLVSQINDFNYSEEEKKEIVKEGTIL